jgi:hypothetical protein
MSTSNVAREILQAFLAQHGLSVEGAQEREDAAVYQLETEHGLTVNLAANPESGVIQAWVPLAEEAPEEKHQQLYAAALSANLPDALDQGGSLALDPEARSLVYQHAYALRHASAEGFARFFAALTETASGLKAAIAALSEGAAVDAPLHPDALRV